MKRTVATLVHACDSLLRFALIALMGVLVLSITWQVTSRYFLRDPSSWTEELARFTLVWAGLLGAVYAYRTHAHVGIDILAEKLSGAGRRRLETLTALCVIAFAVPVIVVGGTNLVLITAELKQTSAALGIQMAWVYAVIPLSGILLSLYAIFNMVDAGDAPAARGEAA